jgi:hypothetical protein
MKYIKIFENFKDTHTELEEKLKEYGIKNYTINDDGTIDVDGDVDLFGKKLTKIPFKFGKVNGDFNIASNYLESLEGSPYYVGCFNCSSNKLINLIGSPSIIEGDLVCSINKLESLEGMTPEIDGSVWLYNNPNLKELDSVSYVSGNIFCSDKVDISKFLGECKNIIQT